MKIIGYKYFLTTLALMAMGALVWAFNQAGKRKLAKKPMVALVNKRIYSNEALLMRLEKMCALISPKNKEIFYEGSFSIKEIGTQTGIDESPVNYLFSKRGDEFYYQTGDIRYFNSKKIGVMIDQAQREIKVLKKVKSNTLYMPTMSIDELPSMIESEGYVLSSSEKGALQTIFLKNKDHFTCREYALTFDTLNYLPKRIFARFTGTANTDQTDGEKHLLIELKKTTSQSAIEHYLAMMPLTFKDKKWVVSSEFKDFRVFGLKKTSLNK